MCGFRLAHLLSGFDARFLYKSGIFSVVFVHDNEQNPFKEKEVTKSLQIIFEEHFPTTNNFLAKHKK